MPKKSKKDVPLNTISHEWLTQSRLKWKESTYSKYYHIVNDVVCGTIGELSVTNLSAEVVQGKINEMLLSGFSVVYARDYVTIINAVLAYAKRKNYNCIDRVRVVYPKKQRDEARTLSVTEQQILLKYLSKKPDLPQLGVILALFTGVRCGELCALQWGDIDLIEGAISITKTMQRIQDHDKKAQTKTKVIIVSPKSNDSCRKIPLPEFLIKLLHDYKCTNPQAFFLSGNSKKHIEPRVMQYKFDKYISDCGLEHINFHALRHTFATRCIELGFDAKSLSEILGHSDVNITLNLYVHSSFALKIDNMNKLNSIAI